MWLNTLFYKTADTSEDCGDISEDCAETGEDCVDKGVDCVDTVEDFHVRIEVFLFDWIILATSSIL